MRHIRAATLVDAGAIAAVYRPYVESTAVSFEQTPPDAEQLSQRMLGTPRLPWLVAEGPAGVAGFAYASAHRARASYLWAVDVSVYLRAEERGRGTGRQLYAALLPVVRELGYVTAHAGIALPNDASVTLHESFGFTLVGVYRKVGFKLGSWYDVGWWSLLLQEPPESPAVPRAWVLAPRPPPRP
jgi:L-amino acid N-acyltransferase YncA